MELRTQTDHLFRRLETKGTLGDQAKREPATFTEGMEMLGYALAADKLISYDNSNIDKDSRPGQVEFTHADFMQKFNADLAKEMPGMAQDPQMSKAEVDEMVASGIFTREEGDQMLQQQAQGDQPKNATSKGDVSKSADGKIRTAMETTGDENDVEYIFSGTNGLNYLNVKPTADGGFVAKAILSISDSGEMVKETLTGDWSQLAQ